MKKILFFVFILFLVMMPINAALPNSIGPISQVGGHVMDDCDNGDDGCYGMGLKVSANTLPVICTQYNKTTPAGVSSCTLTSNWNEKIRYAVAAVINEAKPNINSTNLTTSYFAAELAINNFLNEKGAGGYSIYAPALTSTYRTKYNNYLTIANNAYDEFDSAKQASISLSTSNLTFVLDGGYYKSNTITISGNYDNFTVTTNVGEVVKSTSSFYIKIKDSNITTDTTVTVTVKATKNTPQARNYYCGDDYQTLTPVSVETISSEKSVTASGKIAPKGQLIIKKVDASNNLLAGATIKITGPNNYSKTITSTTSEAIINDLTYGTYIIEEISAPSGYYIAPKQTVTINATTKSKTITLVNKKNKLEISKTDITGTKELVGATLQIEDKNGNIVKYCNGNCKWVSTDKPYVIEGIPAGTYYLKETIAPKGYALNVERVEFKVVNSETIQKVTMKNILNKLIITKKDNHGKNLKGVILQLEDKDGNVVKYCGENKECKWETTDKPYEIEGIPAGTYYLKEVSTLDGYVLLKERVEIKTTEKTVEETINLENKKNRLEIKKVNSKTKEPLKDAVLQIEDEEGNLMKNCMDDKGNKNLECKWMTTEEPYIIEGIPAGTYYIKEVTAPKGYALLTERIKFEIDDSFESLELVVENELEVEVPNTLSSRSALLIVISMFDIALGIGIINYVKKNKVTE